MLLSSDATAKALGIKPATLYAYVSRGLIAPAERHGGKGSWFHPDTVAEFAERRGTRRPDERLTVASAITHIEPFGHSYRGTPATQFSDTPFESLAEHLWNANAAAGEREPLHNPGLSSAGRWTPNPRWVDLGRRALALAAPHAAVHDGLRLVGAAIGANDPLGHDAAADAILATARSLIPTWVLAMSDAEPGPNLEFDLCNAMGGNAKASAERAVLRRALALLADHGLAASTLAARTAAAYGAGPHAILGAALGAFSGDRHGAASLAVERLVRRAIEAGGDVAVGEILAQRGSVPGLGHPLYPDGDPRARSLLAAMRSALPGDRTMSVVQEIIDVTTSRGMPAPNVDMALGAMSVAFGLRSGSGELVFAIARTAGWIAHGIEAQANPPARPRVRYIGPDSGGGAGSGVGEP